MGILFFKLQCAEPNSPQREYECNQCLMGSQTPSPYPNGISDYCKEKQNSIGLTESLLSFQCDSCQGQRKGGVATVIGAVMSMVSLVGLWIGEKMRKLARMASKKNTASIEL